MRIVYFRKKPNSYTGHVDDGILIFDDQGIFTHYLFKPEYKYIEKIHVTDVISGLLRFNAVFNQRDCAMYNHKVSTYKDFLAIPDLIVTAEYTSENNPELFV